MTSSEAMVPLDTLRLSTLEISPSDMGHLISTKLEGTLLELDHLWKLGLYLFYVEYLPARENGQRTDTVSLLCEKETDDGKTEKNRPNRLPRYQRR